MADNSSSMKNKLNVETDKDPIRYRNPRKNIIGLVFDFTAGCALCGEKDAPLTYYTRTKEWLCEVDLKRRRYEKPAIKKMKRTDREKDRWQQLNSYQPPVDNTVTPT